MSYPIYSVAPVNGASIQLNNAPTAPVQANDQRFCTEADAKLILAAFVAAGLPDGSLLDASVATVGGQHFIGVDPNSSVKPWYIQSSTIQGPVGPLLWLMFGPNSVNGGGRGNPGTLSGLMTGNPRWNPTAAPSVTTLPGQIVDSSKDAASFGAAQGVNQGTLSTAQDARLTNIERLVIAMAATIGIK